MPGAQFNLLPNSKIEQATASRKQSRLLSLAIIISAVSLGIFVLTFLTTSVVQKKQLSDADGSIAAANKQLGEIKGLDKILTVQNQLKTLGDLHGKKHIASRIFIYLPQVTPSNVKVTHINMSFEGSTMQIDGTADSQKSVNTFIDTLKYTTFTVGEGSTAQAAFPSVVESSFSVDNSSASYSLNVTFDATLFSNSVSQAPKLNVPKTTTTRSINDDPANVFTGAH